MRWLWVVLSSVLLSGCLQADGPSAADSAGAADGAADAAGAPYTAYDDTVGFTAVGSATDGSTFELPDGGYDTVRVTFHSTDSTWSGDLRLWVTSPSGDELTLLEGSGYGAGGNIFNTGSFTEGGSLGYERGTWKVAVEGTGSADMHVSAEVR